MMGIEELTVNEKVLSALFVIAALACFWFAWTSLKYKELAGARERDNEVLAQENNRLERTLLQACCPAPEEPPRGKKHHVRSHRREESGTETYLRSKRWRRRRFLKKA